MIKHAEKHPGLDVEECFGCRIAGIQFGAQSMPTRKTAVAVASKENQEKELHKDLAAYKRLRQNGVQPKQIDGSHIVEKRAEETWQVETGILPDKINHI